MSVLCIVVFSVIFGICLVSGVVFFVVIWFYSNKI